MRRIPTPAPLLLPSLVAGLALAAGCATAGERSEELVAYRTAIQQQRYVEALGLAEELAAAAPGDADAEQRVLDTRIALLLDRAQRLTFREQPQAALDVLLEAQALDPGNPRVQVWVAKLRTNLAEAWLDVASSYSGDADLAQAEYALRRALLYVPDHPQALHDLERVLVRSAYREDVSRDYFYEGLRKLREARLESADRDLGIATLYDAANDDAARRRVDVRERLALETLASARQLEAEGLLFAAYNEYRGVLFHDPDEAEALEGVRRLGREVQAEQHLRQAEMMVRRREFAAARDELEAARGLTQAMLPEVERLEGEIEEKRWQALYEKALALFEDRRLPEAIDTLDALLAEAVDYRDATDLRELWASNVADAEALYERALATDDLEQRLGLFEQIDEILYPEFRDVPQRLERLREQLAAGGS